MNSIAIYLSLRRTINIVIVKNKRDISNSCIPTHLYHIINNRPVTSFINENGFQIACCCTVVILNKILNGSIFPYCLPISFQMMCYPHINGCSIFWGRKCECCTHSSPIRLVHILYISPVYKPYLWILVYRV